ncbi:MAG: tRNA guanosine(34) transglycosylase Tgt [Thermoanaerobaculia bacterium]
MPDSTARDSSPSLSSLPTPHGAIPLPAFFPDATRAVVKSVDAADLAASGVAAVMVNAFHVTTQPGADVISKLGGLHGFMGWPGPIVTDSGGFQIYSLLRENSRNGSVSAKGFVYRPGGRGGDGDKRLFTPEKSVQQQMRFGADVLFCLDQCTHPEDASDVHLASVERTIAWARLCKAELGRRLAQRKGDGPRPLLFAVIQGGNDQDLRRRCAESLLEIGFDGFGFGGWPIGEEGELVEMVLRIPEMVPRGIPLHGLGIGKPENIVAAYRAGYHTFDSSFPTRAARRRRLMVATRDWAGGRLTGKDFYDVLYLEDERYYRDGRPLDAFCSCLTCRRFSRAYLHHLFRIDDGLANRLATVHNLAFYSRLMAALADER